MSNVIKLSSYARATKSKAGESKVTKPKIGAPRGAKPKTGAPKTRAKASGPKKCSPKDAVCLRIELDECEPLIWRQVWVRGSTSLEELHGIIQCAMGWLSCHLHMFEIGGHRYVSALEKTEALGGWLPDGPSERLDSEHSLAGALGAPMVSEFRYLYDYGDGWSHRIVVEAVTPRDETMRYPLCTGGERACPPEDVGSVPGYDRLLRQLRGRGSRERTELLTWLGGFYDPERFDPNCVNRELWWLLPHLKELESLAEGNPRRRGR